MVRRTLADICRLIAWEKLESWEDTKPTDTEELESIENIQVVEVNQVDSTITESICSNIIQDILERKESDTSISREIMKYWNAKNKLKNAKTMKYKNVDLNSKKLTWESKKIPLEMHTSRMEDAYEIKNSNEVLTTNYKSDVN